MDEHDKSEPEIPIELPATETAQISENSEAKHEEMMECDDQTVTTKSPEHPTSQNSEAKHEEMMECDDQTVTTKSPEHPTSPKALSTTLEVTSEPSATVNELDLNSTTQNTSQPEGNEAEKTKLIETEGETITLVVEEENIPKPETDLNEDVVIMKEVNPIEETNETEEKEDKDKEPPATFDSVLLDENSTEEPDRRPIEEIDPTSKEDSNDGTPDLAADDPLMKDVENQADQDDDADLDQERENELPAASIIEAPEQTDKTETDADKVMLSVKPPGELMEGNFVDVADEDDSLPEDSHMDYVDPIETTEEDKELAQEPEQEAEQEDQPEETDDVFNGKEAEAETILAEDETEVPVTEAEQTTEPVPAEDENKFVITIANRTEKSVCKICSNEEIPKYLAHKNEECECICSNECLEKFKEQHADDFVERILRLRVFAAEETITREPEQLPPPEEEEEAPEEGDEFRKCVTCKKCIDLEDYVTWEAQDYCGEGCLTESQQGINKQCAKCQFPVKENLWGKYCVRFGTTVTQFCRASCLISYKKARKLCQYCQEDLTSDSTAFFCSKRCKEAANPEQCDPKESAPCSVCRQVKEVELKVRGDEKMDPLCSERCLVAYKFVNKVEVVKCVVCPTTFLRKPGDPSVYELDTVHSLCSGECQKIFLIKHRKIVNCSICMVKKYDFDMIRSIENGTSTCVCSLICLTVFFECSYSQIAKSYDVNIPHLEALCKGQNYTYEGKDLASLIEASYHIGKITVQTVIVTKPRHVPKQKNKALMCRPRMLTKAIQHKVKDRSIEVQTDDTTTRWIPIPVPIFVPTPLHMYAQPIPFPTPIPIPLIIPIFILTGRKSVKGIQKEIAKIKNRIPADPLEAEILMMADMAAGDKRNEPTSDSDDDGTHPVQETKIMETSIAQIDNASTSFSDDVLSMAFKMANEYTEPLDLESEVDNSSRMLSTGRRSRGYPQRGGRSSHQRMLEMAKPDENLSLKYTFGVNAWKQWATTKNLELQKLKSPKFVKLDLLQLSAEDLCYCLCQFVKEVRKPNRSPYASDTIYYLCLGIQLYLYENGRIDNLFCDPYYEKFTDAFNEICLSFCQVYNEGQYIVTRVEEEHLWESKQLGAHSPLVLLNTLLFFNTKHFNLTTVDDHLQLSFSHIMKHWKRNANAPNQRNVLLRFYPPSKGAWGKRKVYEQQECLENPLRCPVRLYEFFLSKCPESVKTRNDVFYLQPERSCVPDSPVWYSTSALERHQLEKMLNRMKMIKEISMAILGT